MLFNSLIFLLLFLPLAVIGFYGFATIGHRWAEAWMVAVSLLFYSWWSAPLVFLLGGSIAFNFTCGALILRTQERASLQKLLLTIGIAGDLLLLFYYKYCFALLNWFGGHGFITLAHPYGVILPLGISFYTFTQIGYLVDCQGGVVKGNRFLDYCLFVTFFPHLIAGPILHHREMMPQFAEPETYHFRWENLAVGSTLFLIGLAKKTLLADRFIETVSGTFDHSVHLMLVQAWCGALSYSLQLYFDFSGYSDMAMGLALLFGMRFPANFNSPYRATSIIDFWQRWHMTLTRYLTLYLYNPVALWISRHRLKQGKSVSRKAISTPGGFFSMIALPTFYTMTLAGIWHGAGAAFLVFGLLHATYLTINHAWRSFGPRIPDERPHPVMRCISIVTKVVLTYFAVLISQIFFRAGSVHVACELLRDMSGINGFSGPVDIIFHDKMLCILFLIVWFMPNSLQILNKFQPSLSAIRMDSLIVFEWRPNLAWGVITGVVAALAILAATGLTEFLYFRF